MSDKESKKFFKDAYNKITGKDAKQKDSPENRFVITLSEHNEQGMLVDEVCK